MATGNAPCPCGSGKKLKRCCGEKRSGVQVPERFLDARWAIGFLVAALTAIPFLPALKNGFVWDDAPNLVTNPAFRGFGLAQLGWMVTTVFGGPYQPLTWLSFALDHALWGLEPWGYHLTNILLHSANAAIFFAVCLRLLRHTNREPGEPSSDEMFAAAFAALFFSIHPLRVESVAWATERRDVLSGLFFLLSVLAYLREATRRDDGNLKMKWVAVAFALSLFAKGIGVTLPIALLILDVYPLRRVSFDPREWTWDLVKRPVLEKLPLFGLAVLAGGAGIVGQLRFGGMPALQEHGMASRMAATSYSIVLYVWKTALPLNLLPLYERPLALDPLEIRFLLSGAGILGFTALLLVSRRAWSAMGAAWAFFLVTLAPVSGLAAFGPQIAADRYTYLACLGWAVLAGAGFLWTARRIIVQPQLLACALAPLFLAMGLATWKQTAVWKNDETLWKRVLAHNPQSVLANYGLGATLLEQGRLDEADRYLRRALTLKPEHYQAHYNLAIILIRRGNDDDAANELRAVMRLAPDFAEPFFHLGTILERRKQLPEAERLFIEALRLNPEIRQARIRLAVLFTAEGRLEDAIVQYEEFIKTFPNEAAAWNSLGAILAKVGRVDEAIQRFQQALLLNPDHPLARRNLAGALMLHGRFTDAVREYEQALRLDPGNAQLRRELAAASSAAARHR